MSVGVVDRTGVLLPLTEQVAGRLGMPVVALNAPTLGAQTPRLDVLVLGPKETTRTGLRRASKYAAAHPASVVVGVLDLNTGATEDELLAHGVDRVVRGPVTQARLGAALRRAFGDLDRLALDAIDIVEMPEVVTPEPEVIEIVHVVEVEVAELEPEPEPEPELAPTPAYVITIASATGGCGKTFFATNAAYHLAKAGKRVLLVDTDLQFGEVAAALRVQHPYSLYDGLYDGQGRRLPEDVLAEHIDEIVHHHVLGFDVLTAPRDPALADYVGAKDAEHMLDVVVPRYDVVIVDTPPSINEVVLTCLDRSDIVAVLATLDVPSLKNLSVFLDTLRRLHMDDTRLRLILNKCEGDIGITTAQAQDAFKGAFVGAVPTSRAVPRSINAGTVLLAADVGSEISLRLAEAIVCATPVGLVPAVSTSPVRKSLWARLRARLHRTPSPLGGTS